MTQNTEYIFRCTSEEMGVFYYGANFFKGEETDWDYFMTAFNLFIKGDHLDLMACTIKII